MCFVDLSTALEFIFEWRSFACLKFSMTIKAVTWYFRVIRHFSLDYLEVVCPYFYLYLDFFEVFWVLITLISCLL